MTLFSKYKRQRIVSLWHDSYKAQENSEISKNKENLPATRQGIQKFLKKYEECGTVGKREGVGRKTKISAVDDKMMEDDETTAKELQRMLSEHGHHISERTALKCRTELG